ncbi:alpha/beta fold hydrolase [Oceanivirga salmonicida]|uniref:alpha/beta fold hydrolase n=1 Tax=Oceanivirga salmonicida TaxID=1769291 RepID=UPI0008379C7F|nr:alpha/beta hydrolase [Oceanivirga salmonicida]
MNDKKGESVNNKIGIVFINGAGLNSSIWNDLKQRIDNPILCIDFPNRKSNDKQNLKLTFDDYLNKTIVEIKKWENNDFIIVAHSIGACIGLKVAEQFKKELKGFVAIGSVIPKSGQSFVSSLPFPQKLLFPILLSLFGTKPPKKSIETELCNDLTPEITSKIVNEFTPEAKALYTTKIIFDLPETKRLYVKLINDKSISIDLQNKMAKNLNATKIENIDSGHLPMISKTKELATILSDFTSEIE